MGATLNVRVDRPTVLKRGRRLEYFTLGWNLVEAVVAGLAGLVAGSAALVGFALDSLIESLSGGVLLWRLQDGREDRERLAQRLVAGCFTILASYVAAEAIQTLLTREAPAVSPIGMGLAAVSLIIMPVLARAKRAVAGELGSAALAADSRQTDLCAYLSAILLCGLALNAAFSWWWADPVAALCMIPIMLKEARDSWRGESCGC